MEPFCLTHVASQCDETHVASQLFSSELHKTLHSHPGSVTCTLNVRAATSFASAIGWALHVAAVSEHFPHYNSAYVRFQQSKRQWTLWPSG